MTHDFQLRHQGLSLAPPGCCCMEREQNSENERCIKGSRETKHTETRTHCVLAKLFNDPLAETQTRLATKPKLSRLLPTLSSQEYGTGVTVFDSYAGDFTVVPTLLTQICTWLSVVFLHCMSYISAFSLPLLCWTGNELDRKQLPRPPCQRLLIQECDLKHNEGLSRTESE